MASYGLAIQERRELVGYRTQSDLARAIHGLSDRGSLPEDLQTFSQQWLANLEGDRTGETIGSARPRMIRALAYMLKWSAAEFYEAVGVSIGAVPHYDDPAQARQKRDTSAGSNGWHAPEAPVVIPDALIQAAEEYGGAPELAALREPRWQHYLAKLHYRSRPTTPADWLTVFVALKDRFDPPQVKSGPLNS